ncbi:MAG: DsbA family protein [Pseudomonadota bacterium]
MNDRPSRRRALIGAGALGLTAAGIVALRPREIRTEPIPGLPGFSRVEGGGEISAGNFATIGLDSPSAALPQDMLAEAEAQVARDPVAALRGDGSDITFFSSAGCPLCPVQADRLPGPATLRPLAFFGPASERAARAMIVAPQLHDRLIRTRLVIDDAYLAAILEAEGLDPATHLRRLDAPETTAALALNHALARALQLPGTPGTLIHRTLAVGLMPRSTLTALLRQEET